MYCRYCQQKVEPEVVRKKDAWQNSKKNEYNEFDVFGPLADVELPIRYVEECPRCGRRGLLSLDSEEAQRMKREKRKPWWPF